MTTYNVPHTFIPGTKAKANEVNENFATVLEHIATTKENSADINLSNLTEGAKELIRNVSGTGKLIGELIFSSLPITDASVHLLDGSLIEGEGIYKDFVKYIAELYNASSNIPAYFTTEEAWQASITNYGVCGKFVYNSTNNTVRLPQITGIIEGTTDLSSLGALVEAGLPNITGQFHSTDNAGWANGAFTYQGTSGMGHWNSDDGQHTITFNAANSSKIYGKSNTVQPQTIKQFTYIVVANSKQTEIMVDIDNIATDLNNLIPNNSDKIANYALPSKKLLALTLGEPGATYTAPANGWIYIAGSSNSEQTTNHLVAVYVGNIRYSDVTYGASMMLGVVCPISKGQTFQVDYSRFLCDTFKFHYSIGSESEG